MSAPNDAPILISDIASALERWAPRAAAQSYDNVGLQIGRPNARVGHVLVALEVTPSVVEEAVHGGAQLIVTHHPLMFRPLRSLTPSSLPGALALRLAEHGIALYSAHTNLDAARGGVSFALARQLELQEVEFLQRLPDSLFKLVTFVPADHADHVRIALAEAGAGRIGNYDACAFVAEGAGFFRAGEGTHPFIGTAGGAIEKATEIRLEVELARWDLPRVLTALRDAHPYEEVAYDVYPVVQENSRFGLGAVGRLAEPQSLTAFLDHVAGRLGSASLRFAGDPQKSIERVAVCGGAGSDLIAAAARAKGDAFVTADVTYHRFFDTMAADGAIAMAVIDAGHYETESVCEVLLTEHLAAAFPELTVQRTSTRTSPVQHHTHSHRRDS